jgi:uncharacterized membrane protein (UPF0127 family)
MNPFFSSGTVRETAREEKKELVALLCAVLLLAAACGDGSEPDRAAPSPSPTPTFATATALLDTEDGSTLITVEVAETQAQRSRGLMFREALAEDSGMVFVWFKETSGAFWMKNTLIPLSIAFFDVRGKILRILDMEPCRSEPCKLYDPGVRYMGALEVNQGAFERWGVAEGDFIRLTR